MGSTGCIRDGQVWSRVGKDDEVMDIAGKVKVILHHEAKWPFCPPPYGLGVARHSGLLAARLLACQHRLVCWGMPLTWDMESAHSGPHC